MIGQFCAVLTAWDPVDKDFFGDTYTLTSKACGKSRTFLCEGLHRIMKQTTSLYYRVNGNLDKKGTIFFEKQQYKLNTRLPKN